MSIQSDIEMLSVHAVEVYAKASQLIRRECCGFIS